MNDRLHIDPNVTLTEGDMVQFEGCPEGIDAEARVPIWVTRAAWEEVYGQALLDREENPVVAATIAIEKAARIKFDANEFEDDGSIKIAGDDLG